MIYPNDAVFFARFLDETLWIKIKYPYWKRKKKTDFDLVIFVINNSSSLNRKERERKKGIKTLFDLEKGCLEKSSNIYFETL